jgi:hypothetical protein
MQDGIDNVTIISNEQSKYTYVAKNISSKDKMAEIIHNLPDEKNRDYFSIFEAFGQALKDVDKNRFDCSRPLFLVMVSGDLSFENPDRFGYDFLGSFSALPGKLLFIHNGSYTNLQYKTFTQSVNGQYIDIPSPDQTAELVRLINYLSPYRILIQFPTDPITVPVVFTPLGCFTREKG